MPPTRRGLLGGAVALGAAPGVLIPAAHAANHPDAELIRICHDFAAYEFGAHFAYCAEPDEEKAAEQGLPPDFNALQQITEMQANTPDGWQAKALAYASWRRIGINNPVEGTDEAGQVLLSSLILYMAGPELDSLLALMAERYGPNAARA